MVVERTFSTLRTGPVVLAATPTRLIAKKLIKLELAGRVIDLNGLSFGILAVT